MASVGPDNGESSDHEDPSRCVLCLVSLVEGGLTRTCVTFSRILLEQQIAYTSTMKLLVFIVTLACTQDAQHALEALIRFRQLQLLWVLGELLH